MFHWNGECLQSIRRGDDTAVPVGLFLVGVVLLNHTMVIAVQFLIPLHGTEIGRLQ